MMWVFCVGLCLVQARPEPRPSLASVLDSLATTRSFREVALSPDGKRVAWVESLPAKGGAPDASSIYTAELGSPIAPPQRITAGDGVTVHAEHDLAWSPDSSRLAFLSDKPKPGQMQIYLAATAGPPRQLTHLSG